MSKPPNGWRYWQVGVDSAWEQEKPEARKILENGGESHLSSARFVSPLFVFRSCEQKREHKTFLNQVEMITRFRRSDQ